MNALQDAFDAVLGWVFSTLVQPVLFHAHLMHHWEEAYLGTEVALIGALEILLLALIVVPMEKWRPFEAAQDASAIRTDFAYTLINRLGLLPLLLFTVTLPLEAAIDSQLHAWGIARPSLETLIPGLENNPVLLFAAYLIVLDFVAYWVHRGQHSLGWWWQMHAVHHSQRAMTVWTESRNHYLDDLLGALIFVLIARLIGTPGSQFIWLVFASRLIESLSHANWRIGFGAIGSRLLVDPHFHRNHHAVGLGHEGRARGCNFAVLFPVWDMLFGTAYFNVARDATGIRDQLKGRDYGATLLAQQWLGFKRLLRLETPSKLSSKPL